MTKHGRQTASIALKRVYEEPASEDGRRILVDRLWPRGLSREKAHVDLWLKEVAPSNELRQWFRHDPAKFTEFRRRYEGELNSASGQEALGRIRALAAEGPITLLFAARDMEHNNAVVLRDVLSSL
jgi:uncharacterized protein YeaO (DUF488 family)